MQEVDNNKREDSITSQFQSSSGRGSVYIVGDFFVNPIRESTTKLEDVELNIKQTESNSNEGIILIVDTESNLLNLFVFSGG